MISVITWDANFRESFHTVNFFAEQDFPEDEYEFIWVDYYNSNDKLKKKMADHSNFKLITLGHTLDKQWHLGECINAGVASARGDILVIPDGDIAVEKKFLSKVYFEHKDYDKNVVYYKRYDEPKQHSCEQSRTSVEYLKSHTALYNPTNYAGCLTLRKGSFLKVNGYETHDAFSGPGINGMEMYIRLRNAGFFIKWEPEIKIFHPWHQSSGSAGHSEVEYLKKMKEYYPWINPYAGLKQSWIIYRREMLGEISANETGCNKHLEVMPNVPPMTNAIGPTIPSLFRRALTILRKSLS